MDAYFNAMDSLGSKILDFVDPNGDFTGYTKVRFMKILRKSHGSDFMYEYVDSGASFGVCFCIDPFPSQGYINM